jgi:hypothetical protein
MSLEGKIVNNRYKNGSIAVHAIFNASSAGEEALALLEELFCSAFFDPQTPRDRALYQQGQASVISEIKQMIKNVEEGVYNGSE